MAGTLPRLLVTVTSTTAVSPAATGVAGRGEVTWTAVGSTLSTRAITVPKVTRTGSMKPAPLIVTGVPPEALPKAGSVAIRKKGWATGSWIGTSRLAVTV